MRFLLPLLLAAACKPSGTLSTTASNDDTDGGSATADGPFWGLVNHRLEVFLEDGADDSLRQDPFRYVHADIVIDGVEYGDVGFRVKGGYGSFREWGTGEKNAFILDMNLFVDGQDHQGMNKLVVNNMVQDPSFLHEYTGYSLFRELGLPASRTSFSEVRIDDRKMGLYTFIEPNDANDFLEDHFGNDDGDVYEGAYGADLWQLAMWEMDHDNGEDTELNHLYNLVNALDAIPPDTDPYPTLQEHFDMPAYVLFAATELYMGHWDGYAWTTNNYKIHRDEDGLWTFIPWGLDQTFGDWLGDRAGVLPEPGAEAWLGRIHQMCLASEGCRADLADAFEVVIETAAQMNLRAEAEACDALVSDFRTEEEWANHTAAWTFDFIDLRGEAIRQWLPCLRGC